MEKRRGHPRFVCFADAERIREVHDVEHQYVIASPDWHDFVLVVLILASFRGIAMKSGKQKAPILVVWSKLKGNLALACSRVRHIRRHVLSEFSIQDSLPFKTRYGKDVQLYLKKDSCMDHASVFAKENVQHYGKGRFDCVTTILARSRELDWNRSLLPLVLSSCSICNVVIDLRRCHCIGCRSCREIFFGRTPL